MSEKVVGYSLLTVGIIIILLCGLNVFQIFNKQARPVQFFNFPGISIDLGSAISGSLPPEQKALVALQMGDKAKQEIVPAEVLNDSSNVAIHLFFMGFLASIGYRIASVGVELIRPVIVRVRESREQQKATV